MPQPKFATIKINGKRNGLLEVGKRGKGRVTIDCYGNDEAIKVPAFIVPRSFTVDDLDTYLKNLERCAPYWYESDDTNGHVIAMRRVGQSVSVTQFAGPDVGIEFPWETIMDALKRAMDAAS